MSTTYKSRLEVVASSLETTINTANNLPALTSRTYVFNLTSSNVTITFN